MGVLPGRGQRRDGGARELDGQGLAARETRRSWAGPFARVFADLDDDDAVDAGEDATEADSVWDYNLDVEQHAQGFCAPHPGFTSVCTWDSTSQASWSTNRKQNSAQVFHFVNTFPTT